MQSFSGLPISDSLSAEPSLVIALAQRDHRQTHSLYAVPAPPQALAAPLMQIPYSVWLPPQPAAAASFVGPSGVSLPSS